MRQWKDDIKMDRTEIWRVEWVILISFVPAGNVIPVSPLSNPQPSYYTDWNPCSDKKQEFTATNGRVAVPGVNVCSLQSCMTPAPPPSASPGGLSYYLHVW